MGEREGKKGALQKRSIKWLPWQTDAVSAATRWPAFSHLSLLQAKISDTKKVHKKLLLVSCELPLSSGSVPTSCDTLSPRISLQVWQIGTASTCSDPYSPGWSGWELSVSSGVAWRVLRVRMLLGKSMKTTAVSRDDGEVSRRTGSLSGCHRRRCKGESGG